MNGVSIQDSAIILEIVAIDNKIAAAKVDNSTKIATIGSSTTIEVIDSRILIAIIGHSIIAVAIIVTDHGIITVAIIVTGHGIIIVAIMVTGDSKTTAVVYSNTITIIRINNATIALRNRNATGGKKALWNWMIQCRDSSLLAISIRKDQP